MEKMELKKNEELHQFEWRVEGHLARVEYIETVDQIYLTHTEVPKSLGGRGIASTLIEAILKQLEGGKHTLVPLCPFVAGFIRKHPEYKKLLSKGINI